MMSYVTTFFAALMTLNASLALQDQPSQKAQCAATPAEQVLVTIAVQPESPLGFEDVKFLSCLGRHGGASYRVRNRGTKPVRQLTVAAWTSRATGNLWSWRGKTPEELILPGQLVPMNENGIEIIPLTNELREKLKFANAMQGVVILMAVEVEYADGTKFSDKATSKALEDYLENLSANDP